MPRAVERLDADAMYVLLLLRNFNTEWPSRDGDFWKTPLWSAVNARRADIVKMFLHHSADPNGYQFHCADFDLDFADGKRTPLFEAVTTRRSFLVDLLLRAQADSNRWGMHFSAQS